jgi:hypothetical protein
MGISKTPVTILVRVSTVKQETARQVSELQAYAENKSYEVVEAQICLRLFGAGSKLHGFVNCFWCGNQNVLKINRRERRCGEMADATDLKSSACPS